MNLGRMINETWENYKARRKELNKLSYPSPVLVWDSGVQGTYHKPVEEKIVEASYDV